MSIYTELSPPPAVDLTCSDESLAQQQFLAESDINLMMARYDAGPTGAPHFSDEAKAAREAVFADVVGYEDYQDVIDNHEALKSAFYTLPAWIREQYFSNDPAQVVAYLNDPGSLEEAKALGIVSDSFSV